MPKKRTLRLIMMLLCLAAALLLLVWKLRCPSRLGVYIRENPLPATAQTLALPEDFSMLLNGQPAPYVRQENTYYVPLDLSRGQWVGNLAVGEGSGRYRLSFLPDALWGDPANAVAQGHAFTLVIRQGSAYATCNVVFTGMAVLSLDLPDFDFEDKSDTLYSGSLTVQDPGGPGRDDQSVTCAVKLHAHGGSTRGFAKKSYKLTLTSGGQNLSLPLMGMRSDDDWILNSLYSDPNRIRDQLSLTLWNDVAATSAADYAGVHSQYAELIVNGQYRGIYLLMERLDGKTVQAGGGDVLYKATDWTRPAAADFENATAEQEINGWSIRYPKTGGSWQPILQLFSLLADENATLAQLNELVEMDNYIDIMLYRQLVCGVDNGPKNMYYYARQTGQGVRFYLLPWDMNLTFGYDLAENAVQSGYYDDHVTLLLDDMGDSLPASVRAGEYDQRLAARWQQLRQTVFSQQTLQGKVDQLAAQLTQSGAMARDAATWVHGYVSDDYTELRSFIDRRLQFLDEHYAALAAG